MPPMKARRCAHCGAMKAHAALLIATGRHRQGLAGDARHHGAHRTRRLGRARGAALSHAGRDAARESSIQPTKRSRRQGPAISCWRWARWARSNSIIRATSISSCCSIRKAPILPPGVEQAAAYVRLTRGLVKLLQERTADGYVFRVDLRLRPDPASTQIALSTLERARLLRAPRPELGTLRDDQGAPMRRRHRGRRSVPARRCRRSSGANTWTSPRSPTSTR